MMIKTALSLHRRSGSMDGTDMLVLEQAPEMPPSPSKWISQLLILSAQTELALQRSAADLADYLADHPELDAADVAATLMSGRHAFDARRIAICTGLRDESTELARPSRHKSARRVLRNPPPPIAFMFPAEGSQHLNMGRRLRELNPMFRTQFDRCAEIAARHGAPDIRALVYPATDRAAHVVLGGDGGCLQAAVFAVEYALAQMWKSLGIVPSMMLGHGVGEFVAACIAGVIGLEDALALLVTLGRLMGSRTETIVDDFRDACSRVTLSAPLIPFISSVTGDWISVHDATTPDYWARLLPTPVRISDALARLRAYSCSLLEVGPGTKLTLLAQRHNLSLQADGRDRLIVNSMPAACDVLNEESCILNALGRLWLHGANPLWPQLHPDEERGRVSLPGYPLER